MVLGVIMFRFVNFCNINFANGPEHLITDIPPIPYGVDNATIVECELTINLLYIQG